MSTQQGSDNVIGVSTNIGTNTNTNNNSTNSDSIANSAATSNAKSAYIQEKYPRFKNVHELDYTQMDPAELTTTNFQQDYIVVIRKKPYYAATAQQRTEQKTVPVTTTSIDQETGVETVTTTDTTATVPLTNKYGEIVSPEENYLRVYQVNNFTNIRISTSVNGKHPGNAHVTIRGGERVVCANKSDQDKMGWVSWDEMLGGWLQTDRSSTEDNSCIERQRESLTNSLNLGMNSSSNAKKWSTAEKHWTIGSAAQGVDFKNLLKAREAKYGWRFAEKCDWEPMDELWIFGKSCSAREGDSASDNSLRNASGVLLSQASGGKGDFKMLPIFFGYIDSVTKTFTNAKGGLIISVNASDHLKLLDLSRIVNSPTLTPGITPGGGLDIQYNTTNFGLYDLNQPLYDKTRSQASYSNIVNDEKLKKYVLTNIFAGMYPYEIVQLLGAQAGIPDKYLTERVEKFKEIPFIMKIKQKNGDVFNGETKTRLSVCNEVAEKLFLEFFADEAGNLVLKIPTYALGANRLKANNSGIAYPESLLDSVYGSFVLNPEKGTLNKTQESNSSTNSGLSGGDGSDNSSDSSSDSSDTNDTSDTSNSDSSSDWKEGTDDWRDAGASGRKDTEIDDVDDWRDAGASGRQDETDYSYLNKDLNDSIEVPVYNPDITGDAGGEGTYSGGSDSGDTAGDSGGTTIAEFKGIKTLEIEIDDNHPNLVAIAEKYYNDKTKWINIALENNITDPTTVLYGDKVTIKIDTTDNYSSNIASNKLTASDARKPSVRGALTSSSFGTGSVTDDPAKLKENEYKFDSSLKPSVSSPLDTANAELAANATSSIKKSGKTLSETTDKDIRVLKADKIVSFTLIDSDKEVYNMFEIGGEGLLGIQDAGQGAVLTQIRRAIPDMDSIMKLGMRPHPGIVNTPLVSNVQEAEIMGLVMLMRSQANRFSGSITAIDDSAIKVGTPIRLHMYDEHPMRELAVQRTLTKSDRDSLLADRQKYSEQAVFYITGIERNIQPDNTSLMTLQVKAGRMMNQVSIYDICTPIYKFYYEEAYSKDFTNSLVEYKKVYDCSKDQGEGNWQEYKVDSNASFEYILQTEYGITRTIDNIHAMEIFNGMVALNPKFFGSSAQMTTSFQMNTALASMSGETIKIPAKGTALGTDTAAVIEAKKKEAQEKEAAAKGQNTQATSQSGSSQT